MSTTLSHRTPLDALHRLLDDELAISPVVQELYSSHTAMALVALHRMGAPEPVLRRVLDGLQESEPRIDRADLERLVDEVRRDGPAAVVAAHVPALADSPGTALFHPVIRLAYALDVGHDGQVAAALLDWSRRSEPVPAPGPSSDGRRLADIASDLASESNGAWTYTYDFGAVAELPQVQATTSEITLDEATLDDISSFAIAAHATADDFVTLHLVTGARAVRTVAGLLDERTASRFLGSTAVMMAVAYAAIGAPPLLSTAELDDLRGGPLPDRDEIVERAVLDRDPHVIKLADVALTEEQRTGDALYRLAAARVVGLTRRPGDRGVGV